MGGYGSGRWRLHRRKWRVESCLSLDAGLWQREGILRVNAWQRGSRVWKNPVTGEEDSSISYELSTHELNGWVQLEYTLPDRGERLNYKVDLQTTKPRFGGLRWWFTCPLEGCGRRVRKLYLRGRYFGCRVCHDLTYRSAQEHDKRMKFYREHPEIVEQLLRKPRRGLADMSRLILALKATRG